MAPGADAVSSGFVPPTAQTVIDRFGLIQQPDPNPAPRPGGRAVHTTATRRWLGTADVDDGYGWLERLFQLGWRPDPNDGDWPHVVECFRVHDPKHDPAETGRWFIHLRLTYLERAVYLALYPPGGPPGTTPGSCPATDRPPRGRAVGGYSRMSSS